MSWMVFYTRSDKKDGKIFAGVSPRLQSRAVAIGCDVTKGEARREARPRLSREVVFWEPVPLVAGGDGEV